MSDISSVKFKNRSFCKQFAVKMGSQTGMSSITLLVVIAVSLLLLTCVLKMAPVYVQNLSVQSILEGIEKEYTESKKPLTKPILRTLIFKRLNINQIRVIDKNNLHLEKTAEAFVIVANYEVRVPLFANVDVVMKFDKNRVEIPRAIK